jgi:hypothetical protein
LLDWTTEPNERWTGDFESMSPLATPILMISNTYDPATPIDSGRRLASKLGKNAVLLEQHSWGHCSTSSVSTCTFKIIIDYLKNGNLPPPDTVCENDDKDYNDYFPDVHALAMMMASMGKSVNGTIDLSKGASMFGLMMDEIMA